MTDTLKEKNFEVDQVQDEKTFKKNKWLFTVPGIGRDMLYTLVSTYFLQYVQFGVTLTVAQFATISLLIGILGRIWDGINDPMMGAIIDGSHLKMGKFKPWILIGAILDGTLTIVLFNLASLFNFSNESVGWIYVAIICLVYLLWEAAFTMNDIGYWSMIPSLSRTKQRRDTLTSLTVFFAGIGTIIMTALATFTPGNVVKAFSIYSIVACIVIIGGQTITALGVKEAPRDDKKEEGVSFKRMIKTIISNKQLLWMSLALLCSSAATGIILGLVYNLYYMEVGYDGNIIAFVVIYAACNTILQVFYPKLAQKYGRKKIQFVSFIIMAIGFVGMAVIGWFSWLPFNLITLCIFALFIFGGNTLFYTAEVINMNNCVEYNEYKTGERNEAVVTTMRPLIVKFGDAIKYLVVTLTLIFSGLYATTQKVSAIETQTNMFGNKIYDYSTVEESYNKTLEYLNGLKAVVEAENDAKEAVASQNEVLVQCQFDSEYADAVCKMYLVKTNEKGVAQDGSLVEDLIKNGIEEFVERGYKYDLVINAGDYKDENGEALVVDDVNNAGNLIYQSEKTLGTRIVLRIFSIVLPGLLMFCCMIIQRKKFIIDEKYYDELLEMNAKNHKEAK